MTDRFQRISPFLWFDDQAEEAVALYVSLFEDARVLRVIRYGKAAAQLGRREGAVMTVAFQLAGQELGAINGGPQFRFTEAVSLVVNCRDQAEVDHFWDGLSAGGDPAAQRCGWLKDRFGLSWQIVPTRLLALLADPDPARVLRVTQAMLRMRKLDLAALEGAAAG